eukprot:c2474_g1_i1.p1 GENE.c2474_g1_i1~~c2474_g1_i1.p1  ORF type:complete len:247 (-),score=61.61 c2474_g1_i1:44-784(-)
MTVRPIDRIFTRLGASDRIMGGQSTFMVELFETSNLLRHATTRSLVILDELGRGTSTFDGYAIASAVLSYILDRVRCLCLFATHYHTVSRDFETHKNAANFQMLVLVDEKNNKITHTYQFVPGVCPKSYGTNVAAMAGIAMPIVEAAQRYADAFEMEMEGHPTSMRFIPHLEQSEQAEQLEQHSVTAPPSPPPPPPAPTPVAPHVPLSQIQLDVIRQVSQVVSHAKSDVDLNAFVSLSQLWNQLQK